jgi:hypothetical protein
MGITILIANYLQNIKARIFAPEILNPPNASFYVSIRILRTQNISENIPRGDIIPVAYIKQ